MLASELQDEIDIERLGEASVRDRGGKTKFGEFHCGLRTFRKAGAKREECDFVALANNSSLADFERNADFRDRHADAVAARVTNRRGAIVDRGGGRNHMGELRLVRRSHNYEAWQAAEIGDVE